MHAQRWCGFNSWEIHVLIKCIPLMHYKSLCICQMHKCRLLINCQYRSGIFLYENQADDVFFHLLKIILLPIRSLNSGLYELLCWISKKAKTSAYFFFTPLKNTKKKYIYITLDVYSIYHRLLVYTFCIITDYIYFPYSIS